MPKKRPEDFEYLSNDPDFVPDPEIEQFMEEEIARAPKDPELLAGRLRPDTAGPPHGAARPENKPCVGAGTAPAPNGPELPAGRLRQNTAASPRDAGGDLDASWEDVNDSGTESVSGGHPTPSSEET